MTAPTPAPPQSSAVVNHCNYSMTQVVEALANAEVPDIIVTVCVRSRRPCITWLQGSHGGTLAAVKYLVSLAVSEGLHEAVDALGPSLPVVKKPRLDSGAQTPSAQCRPRCFRGGMFFSQRFAHEVGWSGHAV